MKKMYLFYIFASIFFLSCVDEGSDEQAFDGSEMGVYHNEVLASFEKFAMQDSTRYLPEDNKTVYVNAVADFGCAV